MVQSFGRPTQQPEQVLPTLVMPPVQIPAVLVITPESMQAMREQIREQVAEAVREGFAQAVGDYDPDTAATFTAAGVAEPAAEQLADLAR